MSKSAVPGNPAPLAPAIEVANVTVRYGDVVALDTASIFE